MKQNQRRGSVMLVTVQYFSVSVYDSNHSSTHTHTHTNAMRLNYNYRGV